MALRVVWNFNHSHNNGFASYTSGDTEEIINRFRENSYSFGVEAGASYIMSQRIAFVLGVKEKRDIYSSYYTGSTDSHQWQSLGGDFCFITMVVYAFIKSKNEYHATNHHKRPQHKPPIQRNASAAGVQLNASYNINNKNNLSFGLLP